MSKKNKNKKIWRRVKMISKLLIGIGTATAGIASLISALK